MAAFDVGSGSGGSVNLTLCASVSYSPVVVRGFQLAEVPFVRLSA